MQHTEPTPSDRRRGPGGSRAGGRRWSDNPAIASAVERQLLHVSGLFGSLRERAGYSQAGLGAASGVNPQTILNIEKCQTDPQVSTLVRLAAVFGVELEIRVRRGAPN